MHASFCSLSATKRAATALIRRPSCGSSTWRTCSKNQHTEKTAGLACSGLAGADFLPAARALVGLQNFLAQPDRFRRDFHEFVVGNEFDGLFQAQFAMGN